MVERVSPSVVQIMVRQASPMQRVAAPGDFDDLPPELREFFGPNFRFFFGDQPNFPRQTPDRVGSGSGFFIEGGYIVTNNHVVDNAKKLRVRFDTGEEVEGTLVGTDAKTDLAVIKVDAKHARKPLAWGDSSRSRATMSSPSALRSRSATPSRLASSPPAAATSALDPMTTISKSTPPSIRATRAARCLMRPAR
jgi:S1-C subfamily serine protease